MIGAVSRLFELYFIMIIVRCFLSFFPRVDMNQQPAKFLKEVTDPYLDFFRKFIPPLNGLDFSPIVACIALEIIRVIVCSMLDVIF